LISGSEIKEKFLAVLMPLKALHKLTEGDGYNELNLL
jgi:hypothetical protein